MFYTPSHKNTYLVTYSENPLPSDFNNLETPTGIYPESFVKIRFDLAEILTIRKLDWKMIICLFVCLFAYRFVCFLL